MKLTARKIEIHQFYVKSMLTILFLKVAEFTTSLRSLGSLFQQVAPLGTMQFDQLCEGFCSPGLTI